MGARRFHSQDRIQHQLRSHQGTWDEMVKIGIFCQLFSTVQNNILFTAPLAMTVPLIDCLKISRLLPCFFSFLNRSFSLSSHFL
jgi:hypothetical protein